MKSLVLGAVMVGALVVSATSAVADESAPRPDSAFGMGASGPVPIEPTPSVVSNDGAPVQKSLSRSALGTGVFTVSAQQGRAEASVANLNLASLVRADQIRTWCADGSGGLDIINGAVLGAPLPRNPIGNDTVSVSPLVRVELNHQIAHNDGTLTVEGLSVTVLPGAPSPSRLLTAPEKAALPGLGALGVHVPSAATTVADVLAAVPSAGQEIVIGSVTCGRSPRQQEEQQQEEQQEEPEQSEGPPPAAPKPQIVTAHLPVTG